MTKEENSNKIITIILAIIITIAAFTLIYINIADDDSSEDEDQDTSDNEDSGDTIPDDGTDDSETEEEILLTMTYGEQTLNYSLNTLESFESYTGYGGMIKTGWFPDIVIEGPFNYTGVTISNLLNEFTNIPENYNITVLSSDGKSNEFNISQINGNVPIYDGTSTESYDTEGITMILAYKKEGEYLDDEEEGPLRIVFVDDGVFTSSKLWAKYVVSLEIIET